MFMVAPQTLSNLVTEPDLEQGSLYPALPRIREVSAHIAAEVAGVAYARELATVPASGNLLDFIRSQMFEPAYRNFITG